MVVINCDIAIIGGGIQGLFLAYYAKKTHPDKRIILFEAKVIGSGITAYSGHLHFPYGSGEKHNLTKQSMKLYGDLCDEFKNFPMYKTSAIGICNKENVDNILADIIEKNVSIDLTENVTSNFLSISGLTAYVSKRNISNYLMELISSLGVVIYEGTEIINTKKINDDFELSTRVGYKFRSSVVLNSSGASIYNLINKKDLNLRTKKVIAFHINQLPLNDEPITYFFDDDAFILPQPYYARYLFSYRCEEWDIPLDSNSYMINPIDIENARIVLRKYKSNFDNNILGGQVYVDIYNTPSSSPLIYELESNHFIIGATGGSGVRLAPALAINTLNKIKI